MVYTFFLNLSFRELILSKKINKLGVGGGGGLISG